MNILSICGSLRTKSYNASLCRALAELAPEEMTIVPAPSVGTLPHYDADLQAEGFPAPVLELGKLVADTDGVIIVSPEYNYSIPGVLKNALDWLSRLPNQPFRNKAVALQSVSTGILGGARAQYHMRQVMVFLEARVFNRPEVIVPNAKGKFDEVAGTLTDVATREMISKQLVDFEQFVARR